MIKLHLQLFAGEKTEQATPKKREDARKKGQVAKSNDITTGLILVAIFSFLYLGEGMIREQLLKFFTESLTFDMKKPFTVEQMMPLYNDLLIKIGGVLLPVLGISLVAAIVGNMGQVGIMFSTESIQFKPEKLNPVEGAKRIFSMRALVEFVKSLLKIVLIGAVTFALLFSFLPEIGRLPYIPMHQAVHFLYRSVVLTGLVGGIVILVISIFDYAYQKFDFEKSIRMSKQDIKDEYKQMDGDPHIKGKIKQKQREMAMRRMMQEVPNADVIITNPTHFAIALKYDESRGGAPVVVAKGVDHIAQRIKKLANEHDIVMVENKPLARAMYDAVDIGQEIPEQFFQAVAEVLAHVYRVRGTL
ncbi:MAG: flagellar biosynthesis protein FlhB [Bacilli bacterium]